MGAPHDLSDVGANQVLARDCWNRLVARFLWSLAILFCIVQGFIWQFCGSYSIYVAESWGRWAFMWDWQPEVAAPVWVGEFGTNRNDAWWSHATHLFSSLDMDWAYWAIDGQKTTITSTDTYGLLKTDYKSVRSKWKIKTLRDMMNVSISRSYWINVTQHMFVNSTLVS